MPLSPRDFCLWLNRHLGAGEARTLAPDETAAIRRQLSAVFVHHIDPAMGDTAHQHKLNRIHQADAVSGR